MTPALRHSPVVRGKCRRGVFAMMEHLKVTVRRTEWLSFWESNAMELEVIFREFSKAVRARLAELHPDRKGDGVEFGLFCRWARSIKRQFEKRLKPQPKIKHGWLPADSEPEIDLRMMGEMGVYDSVVPC